LFAKLLTKLYRPLLKASFSNAVRDIIDFAANISPYTNRGAYFSMQFPKRFKTHVLNYSL
jgi:hypothetical protein